MTTLTNATTIAHTLIAGALADGGATVSPVPGILAPRDGYMVGVPAHVAVLPSTLSPAEMLDAAAQWVERVRNRAAWHGYFLGSWVGPEGVYLDVSERIAGSADALAAGIIRGELAVWDIAARAEVPTGVGVVAA